jgi:glycosyltransferase involved in cell wall biosynthesis
LGKVLIIAELFHASPRIPGLAKYLPEFGWQPIILTTPLGQNPDSRFGPPNDFRLKNRVIETFGYVSRQDLAWHTKERLSMSSRKSYQFLRPAFRFLYRHYLNVANYPDATKGWRPFAVKAALELLQNENIDAILTSSSPVTTHIIAHTLKDHHNIPWVADFRDLWTQNHNYPYTRLRKIVERRLELKTLAMADALVAVSQPWAEELQMLHEGKRAYTVNNGFDPEKVSTGETNLTSKLTITYTGQIYTGRQDASKLLTALRDLITHGVIDPNKLEVRFFGVQDKQLSRNISEYGLSDVVKQYGIVSRETSFTKQRESQVLLLLNWESQLEKGVIPGKIFEYFAAQRPILATGGFGNDAVKMLLDETNSGIYCSTIEQIKSTLEELYLEYKKEGKIPYSGIIEKINKYSYREMARKFAEILNSLIKGN